MTIDTTATRQSSGSWLFTWTAGSAPYAVWLDGKLLTSGLTAESYEYTGGEYVDTPPPVEILESGDTPKNQDYPPRYTIQWRGNVNAYAYVVQQYLSGTWTDVGFSIERGKGYYRYETLALADAESHQFKVIALDLYDNEGTAIAFTVSMVRNPAPPDVTLTMTAGDLVVSAS